MLLSRIRPFAFLLALPLSSAAFAEEPVTYQNLLTPMLASGETIIGETIAYPAGTPKVTAATVIIAPGGETGWHSHAVPLFATILEGALTVDYGTKGKKTYKAGDSLLEAVDWPHNGTNRGAVPVKLLAVYMGAEGVANTGMVAGPK